VSSRVARFVPCPLRRHRRGTLAVPLGAIRHGRVLAVDTPRPPDTPTRPDPNCPTSDRSSLSIVPTALEVVVPTLRRSERGYSELPSDPPATGAIPGPSKRSISVGLRSSVPVARTAAPEARDSPEVIGATAPDSSVPSSVGLGPEPNRAPVTLLRAGGRSFPANARRRRTHPSRQLSAGRRSPMSSRFGPIGSNPSSRRVLRPVHGVPPATAGVSPCHCRRPPFRPRDRVPDGTTAPHRSTGPWLGPTADRRDRWV
jgi:hypothetical protein